MSGEDGRSAGADFEPLPGRHRSRQPVMSVKLADAVSFTALQGHPAIGNPDAFPFEIYLTERGAAGAVLRTSTGRITTLSSWVQQASRRKADLERAAHRAPGYQTACLPIRNPLRIGPRRDTQNPTAGRLRVPVKTAALTDAQWIAYR